jgi:hypothetical protein
MNIGTRVTIKEPIPTKGKIIGGLNCIVGNKENIVDFIIRPDAKWLVEYGNNFYGWYSDDDLEERQI